MMIAYESQVANEATEILPTREFARVYHQTLQPPVRFYPRIRSKRKRVEILRTQSLLHSTTITPVSDIRRWEIAGYSGSEPSQSTALSRSWLLNGTRH